MKLIWHGHICFSVETYAGTLVSGPCAVGMIPGLALRSLTPAQPAVLRYLP